MQLDSRDTTVHNKSVPYQKLIEMPSLDFSSKRMMAGYHCHSISSFFDHSSSVVWWWLWIGIADTDLMDLTAVVDIVVEAIRCVHCDYFLLLDIIQ